jgi:hypothetical protein
MNPGSGKTGVDQAGPVEVIASSLSLKSGSLAKLDATARGQLRGRSAPGNRWCEIQYDEFGVVSAIEPPNWSS